jgi:hypothetical protein
MKLDSNDWTSKTKDDMMSRRKKRDVEVEDLRYTRVKV